ncbi:hypothetical protein [Roseovarius aestuarii]|uniref:Uncharacterized protein n=2 Tax=Roseovarius aestuarii TaxID=475083 RepID=A0A1X7BRB5_9RHOB|nr:hypothetical protein [Roseovarius aestuarii]SMC12151.1 hypothetical protein ROA7745_01974 [Roseovarius aestuarii]
MNFEALDGIRLTTLMIAGAVFAAVGLFLLLKPKTAGTAKIELFGLKFESSSAGLLVFLIGAVFLSLPLFVPERTATEGGENGAAETAQSADPETGVSGTALPAEARTTEVEPNDSLAKANELSFGTVVTGTVTDGTSDWYVVPISLSPSNKVEFRLKKMGRISVFARLFDGREQNITSFVSSVGATYRQVLVGDKDRIYVKVYNLGGESVYELSAKAVGGD